MPTMPVLRPLLNIGAALAVGFAAYIGLTSVSTPPADAAVATSLRALVLNEDAFYNYDFKSSERVGDSREVDWAINLVFYNNASIDYVKRTFDRVGYRYGGGAKYFGLNDGNGPEKDEDGGRKNDLAGCGDTNSHYRIYAPVAFDNFYTTGYGFYVLGSTHKDKSEFCPPFASFGDSETVENDLMLNLRQLGGFATFDDYADFVNRQYGTDINESNHVWQNDGRASYVYMP
jgi:hypothetical protein